MLKGWGLIAHGGAKDIFPQDEPSNREGLQQAIDAGSELLKQGKSAIDVVEAVVQILENNPAYNAGLFGSVKNADGKIELTASIMDGKTLDIGAVASICNIQHPVSVAKSLLSEREILLVGEGAQRFATERGFKKMAAPTMDFAGPPGCDTVGCVAYDIHGNFAAATSTGGLEGVRPGRVGDVPLPGCGFYADNNRGAVSASGEGEMIARVMLVSEFLHYLPESTADEAARQAIQLLERVKGEAGIIAISPAGEFGWAHNSQHFAVGMAAENSAPKIYLMKSEEYAK